METGNLSLFNKENSAIVLPSITSDISNEQKELISEDIQRAISGAEVKTLLLPEDKEILENNYIFDFSEVETISVFQREALKSLVSHYGEIQLYLYKKNGLTAFGVGERYKLESMIPLIRQNVFDNGIKIYKNFKRGEPLHEVEYKDITQLRLHL